MVVSGVLQNRATSDINIDPACITRWHAQPLELLAAGSGDKMQAPSPVHEGVCFLCGIEE